MQKVDQPFERKGPPVVLYLDDIATLINRITQHYHIGQILAGDHLLKFEEFPALRAKLEKDRIEYLAFTLLDDKLEKCGSITILPNSTRFEVNRSTPFELGVWSEFRDFLFKHRVGRRFDPFGALLTFIALACLVVGGLSWFQEQAEWAIYVSLFGVALIGWLWVISKLINKSKIILWTREERPRKIPPQIWITILTSTLSAILGAVGKTLVDRWLGGAP